MKISYSVQNLRAIQDMEPVELRPLTILVGANCSGKSTFLRSFSLLRQSLENQTKEPILWYGDIVDYGSFETSVHDNKKKSEIVFKFEIRDFKPSLYYSASESAMSMDENAGKKTLDKISYNVHIKSRNGHAGVNRFELMVEKLKINFSINIDKNNLILYFKYGNISFKEKLNNFVFMDTGELFPNFQFYDRLMQNIDPIYYPLSYQFYRNKLLKLMEDPDIKDMINGKISNNIKQEIDELLFTIPMDEIGINNNTPKNKTVKTKNMLYEILKKNKRQDIINEIDLYCALNFSFSTFQEVAGMLREFVLSTSSVGPVRILGHRFYRIQEFDVESVAARGQNIPMILASMKEKGGLKSFSNWVKQLFGHEIDVVSNKGILSVKVKDEARVENLADTGYGISQLLPVLAQIWLTANPEVLDSNRTKSLSEQSGGKVVSFEEPELHLHPQFQTRLADAFSSAVSIAKSNGLQPTFIIETHSDVMINRLGELIEKREADSRDMQIILFSKDKANPVASKIRTSTYTDDGILRKWPYGFFGY